MGVLTFDELLAGKRCRVAPVEVRGLGLVEMHELSAEDARKADAEVNAAEKEGADTGEVVAKWVGIMMTGKKPSKVQLKAMLSNLSAAQIGAAYFAGIAFNAQTPEAVEKNS